MPLRREILTRWVIAVRALTGVVEIHRQQRNELGVVELLVCHAHPLAQLLTARVVPRDAAFLRGTPRCLTNHHDACPGRRRIDRLPSLLGVLLILRIPANLLGQGRGRTQNLLNHVLGQIVVCGSHARWRLLQIRSDAMPQTPQWMQSWQGSANDGPASSESSHAQSHAGPAEPQRADPPTPGQT